MWYSPTMSTTFIALVSWTLSMMTWLQPEAVTPWFATYEQTALTFAQVAEESPLFEGESGPRRTVAMLVSVAWFESRFDLKAIGDQGRSFCMFQISRSNHKWLGVTKTELLESVDTCTRAAHTMMKTSLSNCRGKPFEDRLGWYAVGGPGCADSVKGRHRVLKAKWLFANFPFQADDNG